MLLWFGIYEVFQRHWSKTGQLGQHDVATPFFGGAGDRLWFLFKANVVAPDWADKGIMSRSRNASKYEDR